MMFLSRTCGGANVAATALLEGVDRAVSAFVTQLARGETAFAGCCHILERCSVSMGHDRSLSNAPARKKDES
jgi:hypothetical protein